MAHNGQYGMTALAYIAIAYVSNVTALDNGFTGFTLASGEAYVSDGLFERNGTGAFFHTRRLELSDSRAAYNHGGTYDDTANGSGFGVASSSGSIRNIESVGNLEAGLEVGDSGSGSGAALMIVEGARLENNRVGIIDLNFPLLYLSIRETVVRGNEIGIAFLRTYDLSIRETLFEDNSLGPQINPSFLWFFGESFSGELLDFIGNGTNVEVNLLDGATGQIHCSNFGTSTAGIGLRLQSEVGFDARNNFWSSADGPTHPNNPGGQGEHILDSANGGAGTVTFQPFLRFPATEADCPVSVVEVPVDRPFLILLALLLGALATIRIHLG